MSIKNSLATWIAILTLGGSTLGQVTFDRVMITEVSWGDPDGIEITNFSGVQQDLSSWYVEWDDGTLRTSSPLGVVLPAGDMLVVKEPFGVIEELPTSVLAIVALPSIGTTTAAFDVTLRDGLGQVRDLVRVSNTAGTSPIISLGGSFRGLALRGALTGGSGDVSVERIWGLDSDGGADWTEQTVRSFGLENRNSGPRGSDFPALVAMKLNEIDPGQSFIELRNPNPVWIELQGWFLVVSREQGLAPSVTRPFPASFQIPPNGYAVVGAGPPPAELPVFAPYANTDIAGSTPLFFGSREFSVGLYDQLGRPCDIVRTTGDNDNVVHNHPRAPAPWDDFLGAAGRNANGGSGGIGRGATGADNDLGSDWSPLFQRTMGSANSGFTGPPGSASLLDVRIDETPNGNGLSIILNAGSTAASGSWSFLFSVGHAFGEGTGLGGLGPDALSNWISGSLYGGLSGVLDVRGSGRLDFAPGSLPGGVEIDCIFVVQLPAELLITPIVLFDT